MATVPTSYQGSKIYSKVLDEILKSYPDPLKLGDFPLMIRMETEGFKKLTDKTGAHLFLVSLELMKKE